MSEQKLKPRPAATLLLLREASTAPEVFMLQRTSKAAFLPGAFVFPGGAIDPRRSRFDWDVAGWTLAPLAAVPVTSPRP